MGKCGEKISPDNYAHYSQTFLAQYAAVVSDQRESLFPAHQAHASYSSLPAFSLHSQPAMPSFPLHFPVREQASAGSTEGRRRQNATNNTFISGPCTHLQQ